MVGRLCSIVLALMLVGGCSKIAALATPADGSVDAGSAGALDGGVTPAPAPSAPRAGLAVPGLDRLARRPLVALYETDPWAQVLGAGVPSFVLYEDGHVVYLQDKTQMEGDIGREGAHDFATKLVKDGVPSLPERGDLAPMTTDQRSVVILLRDGDRWWKSSYRGLSRSGEPTVENGGRASPVFVSAYRSMLSFHAPNEAPFRPQRIEIMLWPFDHTKKTPAPWPKGVPQPPSSMEAPDGGVYKHFVSGEHEARVRDFMHSLEMGQAVALFGRKWSIGMRPVVEGDEYLSGVHMALHRALIEREKEHAR